MVRKRLLISSLRPELTVPKVLHKLLLSVTFSLLFLSGVQQNDTSRVIIPGEKPLQQTEPFSSPHKTKRPRLDEPPTGGLIVLCSGRIFSNSFIQAKHYCLTLLLSFLHFPSLLPHTFSKFPPSQQPPLPQAWRTREGLPPA